MKLVDILERATDFGSFRSRANFFSFALKLLIYIVPAVILGHYTDTLTQRVKKDKVLGDDILYYIIFQTMIIISSLYLLILFLSDFMSEFQVTTAGGFFIVLYFGIQTKYIDMIKQYMT